MMNLSEQSHSSITAALQEALTQYILEEEQSVVTDIHIQPNFDSGELIIFNDDDVELARTIVDEWVDADSDNILQQVESVLRDAVYTLRNNGWLERVCLVKPYSFVLVDDEKETLSEILLVDDEETLLLNDELLKGLDKELDDFLANLLAK